MATQAGFAAFIKTRINELFKNILNEYKVYLETSDSCSALVDNIPGGWFTEDAISEMENFDKDFVCHPDEPYEGLLFSIISLQENCNMGLDQ